MGMRWTRHKFYGMKNGDCTGFGCEGVNFLQSSSYGTKFWICDQNSFDNTWMFQLLQHSAYTVSSKSFPVFLILACQRVGWVYMRSWEVTQPGQMIPTDQRDILYHMTLCSAMKALGKNEEMGTSRVMMLVFPSNHHTWGSPTFLEVVKHLLTDGNYFIFFFFCLCAQLLLCLYLNRQVFSLLPSQFSPSSHCGGMSEQLCGVELPSSINPQQNFISYL